MKLTVKQILQKGVEAHRAGNLEEARLYYSSVLKSNSGNADANNNMGILAVSTGQAAKSISFFAKALDANPSIPQFWLSYIEALLNLAKFDDAKDLISRAVRMISKLSILKRYRKK